MEYPDSWDNDMNEGDELLNARETITVSSIHGVGKEAETENKEIERDRIELTKKEIEK